MVAVAQKKAPDTTKAETPLRVLFVCTGNTCRSPMAAALVNGQGAAGVLADSAGLFALDGAPISPEAVTVLCEAGVAATGENDYPAHRAKQPSAELLARVDRIYPMSEGHAMQLLMRYPEYATKLCRLPIEITDPYGGGLDAYRLCLAQLRMALAAAGLLREVTQ